MQSKLTFKVDEIEIFKNKIVTFRIFDSAIAKQKLNCAHTVEH